MTLGGEIDFSLHAPYEIKKYFINFKAVEIWVKIY